MSLSYDYYNAVLYVINEIGQGRTLTASCDLANITIPAFKRYVDQDETLKDLYADAVERGNDALTDALLDVQNHAIYGHTDSKMAAIQSKNIQWVLSKRDPKRFGERIEIKHELSLDRAITDALSAAKTRAVVSLPAPQIEDAVVIDDDAELLRQLMYG
jgi:hypothetical protein